MHRLIQLIIALCVLSAFVVAPIAAAEVDLAAANGPVPFGNAALDDSADLTVPEDTDDTEEDDTEESGDPVDPTTTAKPEKRRLCAPVVAVAAVPEAVEFFSVIGTAVMAGGVFLAISDNLGISWDGATESWNDFVSSVQDGVNDLLSTDKKILVNSGEGQAALQSVYEVYCSSDGDKRKDDKWYFKAYWVGGKVLINPKPMNAQQAVKAMDQGMNIMTLNKNLATHVVERFEMEGASPTRWVQMPAERHENKNEDRYYYHLHYGNKSPKDKKDRRHCWMWIDP